MRFFFCDGAAGSQQTLHNVSTFSAGESLLAAVGMSGNDKLFVKPKTAIVSNDARSKIASKMLVEQCHKRFTPASILLRGTSAEERAPR